MSTASSDSVAPAPLLPLGALAVGAVVGADTTEVGVVGTLSDWDVEVGAAAGVRSLAEHAVAVSMRTTASVESRLRDQEKEARDGFAGRAPIPQVLTELAVVVAHVVADGIAGWIPIISPQNRRCQRALSVRRRDRRSLL